MVQRPPTVFATCPLSLVHGTVRRTGTAGAPGLGAAVRNEYVYPPVCSLMITAKCGYAIPLACYSDRISVVWASHSGSSTRIGQGGGLALDIESGEPNASFSRDKVSLSSAEDTMSDDTPGPAFAADMSIASSVNNIASPVLTHDRVRCYVYMSSGRGQVRLG